MKDALEVAIEAARAAGKIQRDRSQSIGRISSKGLRDLVTEVDILCEQEVIRIIKKRFPDHQFLAEESGASQSTSSPSKWIIDPLDGTINYAHGFPCYCVSIGLEHEGEIIVGVVTTLIWTNCLWPKKARARPSTPSPFPYPPYPN